MNIHIDERRCTGHGRCYSLAPEMFEADDAGFGRVIVAEIAPEREAKARVAGDGCPERAIVIEN